MNTIRPLADLVLLTPVEAVSKSAGGLFLPDTAKETPDEGIVKAKGPDATNDIAIGDRVIYKRFAGDEVKVGPDTFKLVTSGDLLAVYVESDEIPV